jgi:4-hydroxy-tetrahydrodipicolinate reductase
MKKQVGIIGISGRIGSLLIKLLEKSGHFSLYGGVHGTSTMTDWADVVQNSSILVDFSRPAATEKAVEMAAAAGIPVVSGTSGLADEHWTKIKKFAKHIPILHASNFSTITSLMAIFLRQCSGILDDFDFSIVDVHHRGKVDSPSGTALFLQQQAGRRAQIASIRSGNIAGYHSCDFCGDNEMLTLSHRVFDRNAFPQGALECALWLLNQKPRLYNMEDYLREKLRQASLFSHTQS